MTDRTTRRGNSIRGPHSALTDFLASNNISAYQIRLDAERRRREAERQAAREQQEQEVEDEEYNEEIEETAEERKKRKRKEAAALQKIKKSKEYARRRAAQGCSSSEDDDLLAREMWYQKSLPVPGQLENCELCGKRFTVTAYSKTGPNGGLLCTKCSKELQAEDAKKKPKKTGPRISRRKNQSRLLDGFAQPGAVSLAEMCTKKVADNINDIEEFGDLPPNLLRRLSQILSKRRVITPRTLQLFLRSDLESIDIYDCAKLETEDFERIFMCMPRLVNVNLRFAGQLKDSVLEYAMGRPLRIKHLYLDATNLVSDGCWRQLLIKLGPQLETLKLSNLDSSFDDETVATLATHCPNLRRLKLKSCWKLGDGALDAISRMEALEHLSLEFIRPTQPEKVVHLVEQRGPKLRTLSLQSFRDTDDRLLDAIHQHCRQLEKLRLADNSVCTDQGYTRLFTEWDNPALRFVDLSSTRDVDNANPDGPEEPIGLASQGIAALMQHSGSRLEVLNISSCRHISHEAFEQVFHADQRYPRLREMDISFQTSLDDFLVASIFRSCPALQKLTAFGCFKVRDVRVPAGVALIGAGRPQESIIMEGTYAE
ncbi:hypothetical protein VTN49DRAFT_2107 [Thermomyces lanuginosus]|uniref:uncharacterized protein n=1 Tax=Thermomyces lanuginosus TaxID=5541 RepID=UPI0037420A6A